MAKKYRAVENNVHWLTWVVMGALVAVMVVLLVVLQPSPKTVFYDSYSAVATDVNFENKLPKENNYILLDKLDDGFLGISKGLYTIGNKKDQVSIIYFGAPSIENGSATLANVYARLYGSDKMKPVIAPAELYVTLEDQVKLYHFEQNGVNFNKIVEKLNDKYEDANINAQTVPFVLVLLNGEVIDFAVLTQSNVPLQLMNFYNEVLEHEAVQALLS